MCSLFMHKRLKSRTSYEEIRFLSLDDIAVFASHSTAQHKEQQ